MNVKEKKWVWCLVGNIVKKHYYGESKELRIGTKQFRPGAKVYMAPANWGDGYEYIAVIGCPRHSRKYIEIITPSVFIENFRIQKVYSPLILSMMEHSKIHWWDSSEDSCRKINDLIEELKNRKTFKLYESVRIKSSGITGVVVAEDTDGGTKPPIYFVEKDDEYKTGEPDNDCVWCDPEEIEYV